MFVCFVVVVSFFVVVFLFVCFVFVFVFVCLFLFLFVLVFFFCFFFLGGSLFVRVRFHVILPTGQPLTSSRRQGEMVKLDTFTLILLATTTFSTTSSKSPLV